MCRVAGGPRLASEIRSLREKKGLSQRQLAEFVGTAQSAIARLEGRRISPSLPTLDRIANALGAEVTATFTDMTDFGWMPDQGVEADRARST